MVPIVDPGFAVRQNYSLYSDNKNTGTFIQMNGKDFVGEVWPVDSVFVDFFNSKV